MMGGIEYDLTRAIPASPAEGEKGEATRPIRGTMDSGNEGYVDGGWYAESAISQRKQGGKIRSFYS